MKIYKHPDVHLDECQPKRFSFFTLTGLFVAVALQLSAQTAVADDQVVHSITLDIAEGTRLEDALIEWGRNTGMTVMIDTRSTAGLLVNKMHGKFNADDALKKLLDNSGLAYTKQGRIVRIIQTNRAVRYERGNADIAEISSTSSDFNLTSATRDEESDNGSGPSDNSDNSSDPSDNSDKLDEVLVTAERKGEAERLQDVPVPISVISAQALMDSNKAQLLDYFDQIPGLMVTQQGPITMVSIRGITTGVNNNPTVGFTLDDVPLGAAENAVAYQIPVINPADLAQVEVLRGPQGTLYGDNSMGGLVRYVTVDPSTDRIFGDVRIGGDEVVNGRHLGYNTSAAVNFPITDTLAIRASAFTRLDPGYIDNIVTGARGVNTSKAGGGRISAKWMPSEDFSLKFSAMYEKSYQDGASSIDVPSSAFPQTLSLRGLQQIYWWGTGMNDETYQSVSLNLNANIAGVKISAISGYSVSTAAALQDLTAFDPVGPGEGAPVYDYNKTRKFTQEIRLTDTLGSQIEWLLGGFYNQEHIGTLQETSETEQVTGAYVGAPGSFYYSGGANYGTAPAIFKEYAGFGSLTWKVTSQFDVQFGARESYLSTPTVSQGSYYGGLAFSEPPGPSTYQPPSPEYWKANSFTYLLSPRFKLSPDAMIYARVANGFRPGYGTSNPQPTDSCVQENIPCLIHPDKTINYEIGAKADFLNHTLSIDSSVYFIHWQDIQLELNTNTPGVQYSGNGSGAKSQGADLSVDWKPLEGLTVSTWGAWNQAKITQPFAQGAAGQPLPYSARFSANFSVEKDVLITSSMQAFFIGKEIYMGERLGEFTGLNLPRQDLPAYSETDFNTGIKARPWTFNLYVNNVTDRRGIITAGVFPPYEDVIITPRTIGISVERTF